MTGRAKLPLVAICGRPNVGKSTLFNRIIGRQSAIVHSEEGITRDRTYGQAEWNGRRFRVVDTGGIVEHPVDPLTHKVQEQVRKALSEACVIVFVLDGREEITRTDLVVRDELFRYGKPVVIAVNKLDNAALQENRHEFHVLGLGEPHAISSTHNLGVGELLDAVIALLPDTGVVGGGEEDRVEQPFQAAHSPEPIKVAIIGKPNVGKSSFVNALLNEDRTIVDERPGTTRDAVDIEFHWQGRDYLLIDTAGLRKKGGIRNEVEHFSVSRALRAVRRADVSLLMMEATGGLTEQDKRIADYITEAGAGMVLVWTKWDLVTDKEARFKELAEELHWKAPFLKHVPSVTVSNVTRQRLMTAFEHINHVAVEAAKRIPTAELNRLVADIRAHPAAAAHKGRQAKVLYATQVSIKPTTFALFVNQKRLFHFSYLRHIENRIRERYGFAGVPIRLELREGKPQP